MTLITRNKNYTAIESINGKRMWHSTKTPNRKLAEKRAKAYFDAIRADNLEAANLLTNRRGGATPTFKQLFEYYLEESVCRPATAQENVNCLKLILLETLGSFDETAPVILGGKVVSEWEKIRHRRTKGILAMHSAKRTCFGTVRKAKSVFTKKMQQRYLDAGMRIDVKDFLARSVENGPSIRYKAPKDQGLAPRTFQASKKLREDDPQAFICFLLAMQAGLRKSEIANAKVFWLEDQLIHVQPDGEYDTKNSHEREVPINEDTYKILLEVIGERGCDGYILTGRITERTDRVFRRVNQWLTDLGWTHSGKRIHELRKWYGSQVAKIGGIHAAQHLLGHMDYSTTDRYYADPGAKIAIGE